jgi:hypothetical protein
VLSFKEFMKKKKDLNDKIKMREENKGKVLHHPVVLNTTESNE